LVNCPKCKTDNTKPEKAWRYGQFSVQAYTCKECKTKFREYTQNGKHTFALKLEKGKGYVKA